ncbi:hypothetical protein M8C21_001615 [Ambrosia artemisiifolia]|uniref:Uncharacterized protein n=1 Tax=Ambrosia artemisiifolia TaxID=4212 RepID=A0AAD5CHV0_AMBAR|nr:hypothetical protein M8C21_001615 [Ambrosia artemisiifolia]
MVQNWKQVHCQIHLSIYPQGQRCCSSEADCYIFAETGQEHDIMVAISTARSSTTPIIGCLGARSRQVFNGLHSILGQVIYDKRLDKFLIFWLRFEPVSAGRSFHVLMSAGL